MRVLIVLALLLGVGGVRAADAAAGCNLGATHEFSFGSSDAVDTITAQVDRLVVRQGDRPLCRA